jgi:hypothetical protein
LTAPKTKQKLKKDEWRLDRHAEATDNSPAANIYRRVDVVQELRCYFKDSCGGKHLHLGATNDEACVDYRTCELTTKRPISRTTAARALLSQRFMICKIDIFRINIGDLVGVTNDYAVFKNTQNEVFTFVIKKTPLRCHKEVEAERWLEDCLEIESGRQWVPPASPGTNRCLWNRVESPIYDHIPLFEHVRRNHRPLADQTPSHMVTQP